MKKSDNRSGQASGKFARLAVPLMAGLFGSASMAAAQTETDRENSMADHEALALSASEADGRVSLELVAQSQVDQRVEYALELVGNSTARHKGSTQIAAGERIVLSTLKGSYSDTWCATVDVTESSGQSYTLKAGDCA